MRFFQRLNFSILPPHEFIIFYFIFNYSLFIMITNLTTSNFSHHIIFGLLSRKSLIWQDNLLTKCLQFYFEFLGFFIWFFLILFFSVSCLLSLTELVRIQLFLLFEHLLWECQKILKFFAYLLYKRQEFKNFIFKLLSDVCYFIFFCLTWFFIWKVLKFLYKWSGLIYRFSIINHCMLKIFSIWHSLFFFRFHSRIF